MPEFPLLFEPCKHMQIYLGLMHFGLRGSFLIITFTFNNLITKLNLGFYALFNRHGHIETGAQLNNLITTLHSVGTFLVAMIFFIDCLPNCFIIFIFFCD